MSERLLTRRQVAEMLGVSVSTVYEKMRLPEDQHPLPKPVRLGKQARRWKESEVLAWIEALPEADFDEWQSPKKKRRKQAEASPAPRAAAA